MINGRPPNPKPPREDFSQEVARVLAAKASGEWRGGGSVRLRLKLGEFYIPASSVRSEAANRANKSEAKIN